jgi:hypothetical protein
MEFTTMPLFLDLAPSVEAHLRTLAHARDLSVSEFVKTLLERFDEQGPDDRGSDKNEDPQSIANQTVAAWHEAQNENRELVVQAITAKNNLISEADRHDRIIGGLKQRGADALRNGNTDLARKFFEEMKIHEQLALTLHSHVATAEETVEKIKALIRAQENGIRIKTAEIYLGSVLRNHVPIIESVYRTLLHADRLPAMSFDWTPENEQAFEEWSQAHAG